ncbi:AI-2E family transporter [Clostridium hydrogeniformans]|uniref:AI-2E family transporter n=1 Tax=Clostridium hydrogeniformans TaxID=349933 RepID=UPI0004867360|nr:AI-2E family transporter [Clostridium hydrogeniformans]
MIHRKRIINLIGLLFIIIVITLVIKNYFKPFFIILIFSLGGTPIIKLMERLHLFNKNIRALISIIIINLLVISLFFYVGNNIYDIINRNLIEKDSDMIKNFIGFIYDVKEVISLKIGDINLNDFNIINKGIITKSALYTTDSIVAYFIGNIASYFILSDKYAILKFVKLLLGDKIYDNLCSKTSNLKEVAVIEVILILISTLIIILGFFILNIPNGFILGIICGILDILPYVGTILVFIPLIIYNIFLKNYFISIGLIGLYFLVEIIRQILEAKFISNKLDIHPLAIIISLYIGIKVFGVIGGLAGMVYIILSKEILIIDQEETE